MLNQYWPEDEQVRRIMHTEAELAAEHVLLAVHEPMRLSHRYKGDDNGELKTENDLLNELLKQEYPIPIVGPPGTGKSHLVCWLEAKLKVNKDCDDWHMIRIPKAASLRQVLELLLDGLEDTSLKETRAKIKKIGNELKVDQVANRLITDIKSALDELFGKADFQIKQQQLIDPDSITKGQVSRHALLKRHAGYEGLDSLIGDSTFKQRLIGEDKCLYRVAKRFTEGKKRQEEDEGKKAIVTLDDLGMHNPDYLKFSKVAQDYISRVQLSGEKGQSEVVDLLNELLDDALHRTALNLYQVEGFTDLFTEIRRYLKQKKQTLVLLIEDLSAISAIKDELLDNLLVNSVYRGEEELCPIRSVFAVTSDAEGYKAYSGRRDTILSRTGNKEWHIDDSSSDQVETMSRIEDLCGRYLNAARIGFKRLKDTRELANEASEWPGIWNSSVADDVEIIKTFGESRNGHSLFPFNKNALRAFADAYCYRSGKLQYVPRDIVDLILKDVLTSYREQFIDKKFPSAKLPSALPNAQDHGALHIASQLLIGLKSKIEMTGRLETLVKIWGYQTEDLQELVDAMPHQVARLFGEEELAKLLTDIVPGMTHVHPSNPSLPVNPIQVIVPKTPIPEEGNQLNKISRDVDSWFSGNPEISQDNAKLIRKVLVKGLLNFLKRDYEGWVSVKGLIKGLVGIKPPIHVALNRTPPSKVILFFGYPPKDPKDSRDTGHYGKDLPIFKEFLIALKRLEYHNTIRYGDKWLDHPKSWSYKDGFRDYCHFQDFINRWVVESIEILVKKNREAAEKSIKVHVSNALIFDPSLKTFEEKLRFACHSYESVSKPDEGFYPPPGINTLVIPTPINDWNEKVLSIANAWDQSKNELFNVFTPGHAYAIEGDLLKPIFSSGFDPIMPFSNEVSRLAKRAHEKLKSDYQVLELLKDCLTEEEFKSTLTDLSHILNGLSEAGAYSDASEMTVRRVSEKVNSVLGADSWPTAQALLRLMGPFEAITIISNLSKVDKTKADDVGSILSVWKQQYKYANEYIRPKNVASGNSDTATEKRQVQDHLNNIELKLADLEAFNND